ncbi:hypothetical protein SCLCIDRAFT_39269, partial [Scleroderma citrinum Foug A]
CVTGLSSCLVGERFQWSNDTTTKYFKHILVFFSSSPFYDAQVHFPMNQTPIVQAILGSPRFKYFDKCISTIDGTHICVFSSTADHMFMHNRK